MEDVCYKGSEEPNHDAVIIGWDDDYPKEKFASNPESDGAFLCVNSWGENFGDGGFFHVSYEDSRIAESGISYCGIGPADNYRQELPERPLRLDRADGISESRRPGWPTRIRRSRTRRWRRWAFMLRRRTRNTEVYAV